MQRERTYLPIVKIVPGLVLRYDQCIDAHGSGRPKDLSIDAKKVAIKSYAGILSPSARSKLIKAINLLVAISLPKKAIQFSTGKEFEFRINFITLTLPAAQGTITDKQLKQVALKQWVEYWKDRNTGMSYVWRAERQKNGNLHFHIITDRYIHFKEIRESWNARLAPLGFIDKFEAKWKHREPNSTDVHSVQKIKNLGAYISKYMSKGEKEGQSIEGKVWDCSRNLKSNHSCSIVANSQECIFFQALMDSLPFESFSTDFCGGIRMSEEEMKLYLPKHWQEQYESYLHAVRSSA